MSSIAPKPIIKDALQTWRVMPGMTYALVLDIEQNIWIVESCPAGTQFWTVEQAAQLSHGSRTRAALQEAVRAGRLLAKETATAMNYAKSQTEATDETVLSWLESHRPLLSA